MFFHYSLMHSADSSPDVETHYLRSKVGLGFRIIRNLHLFTYHAYFNCQYFSKIISTLLFLYPQTP